MLDLGVTGVFRRHRVDNAVVKLVSPFPALRPGQEFVDGHSLFLLHSHAHPLPCASPLER
jgi:hypothetical protein